MSINLLCPPPQKKKINPCLEMERDLLKLNDNLNHLFTCKGHTFMETGNNLKKKKSQDAESYQRTNNIFLL